MKFLFLMFACFFIGCFDTGVLPSAGMPEEHVCLTSYESAAIYHNNVCNLRWLPDSIPVLVRPYDGFVWSDFAQDAIDLSIQIINDDLQMEFLTLNQNVAGNGVITIRELYEMNDGPLRGNAAFYTADDIVRNVPAFLNVKIGVYQTFYHNASFDITILHELGHAIGIGHPKECTKQNDLNDVDCQCHAMNSCMLRFRDVDINALLELYSHPEYQYFYR